MSRGRYIINAVECDGRHCMDFYEGLPGQTWPRVLRDARSDGWQSTGRSGSAKHYCPNCQKARSTHPKET